jgi:hypothetical protein
MNRRNFLQLFASASAAAGLGLTVPALAAPIATGPRCSVRYVEAFDVLHAHMTYRLDFGRGVTLQVPKQIERGMVYHDVGEGQLLEVCALMRKEVPDIPERSVLASIIADMRDNQIFGVTWSVA